MDRLRVARCDRRHVDDQVANGCAIEQAVLTKNNRLGVGSVRNHDDRDVAFLSDIGGGGACRRAVGHQLVHCSRGKSVEHRYRVARLDQVLRHGLTHDPEANESDFFCHILTLSSYWLLVDACAKASANARV